VRAIAAPTSDPVRGGGKLLAAVHAAGLDELATDGFSHAPVLSLPAGTRLWTPTTGAASSSPKALDGVEAGRVRIWTARTGGLARVSTEGF